MNDRVDDSQLIFSTYLHYRRWISQLVPSLIPDVEVSFQQLNVLYLVRTLNASMAEISRILGVAPTVITGLVDRLESRGLIRREAHPSDRRRIQLVLTERGMEISTHVEKELVSRMKNEVSKLDPAAQQQMRVGLEIFEQVTLGLNASLEQSED